MTKQTTSAAIWEAPGKPVPHAGELEAMRSGMADLVELLTYARPHGSQGELTFLKEWLLPRLRALGCEPALDDFGNIWASVPAPDLSGPSFLWSCHVDTVHSPTATRQGVRWAADGRTLELAKRKPGRCLGADDGAGVWLLLRMIGARVPGTYVFHRGEEVGRLGSIWVAENTPDKLKGFDACVAFDRRAYNNLITHQMGERCASEAFSDSFALALNSMGTGLTYRSDDTGSFTDSYSYAYHISECANLSVGYDCEHGPKETLDALHLWRLCGAICGADLSSVVCERDCSYVDWGDDWRHGYAGGWARGGREGFYPVGGSRTGAAAWGGDYAELDEREALLELIRRWPAAVADCLTQFGLGADEIADNMTLTEIGAAQASGLLGGDYGKLPVASGGGWDVERD